MDITNILKNTKKIAIVGYSDKPNRDSHIVAHFLVDHGYDVFAVNPSLVGQTFNGRPIFENLSDIGEQIDMVDIFRKSNAVPDIVDQVIHLMDGVKTVWMQIGVEHENAAKVAQEAGMNVVQNLCTKREILRLGLSRFVENNTV